jgi:acetyl-CoA acetyltransferase
MSRRTLRGSAAVAGVSETIVHRRGESGRSQTQLALSGIVGACADAGLSPRQVDGFVSFGYDANSGTRLASALGVDELRWSSLVWGGGGGGVAAAVGQAAAAIHAGQARVVAVCRSLAEQDTGRVNLAGAHFGPHYRAHGVVTPGQLCALRIQRLLEVDGVPSSALEAVVLATYHHAQQNPGALAYGRPLDAEAYRSARWISEPLRLFDCSRETDGAAAVILTTREHAEALRADPVYVLAAAQGGGGRWGELLENEEDYTSSGFRPVAERLWAESGLGPADVDVIQVYENFSGAAVASLIDHGFCTVADAGERLTLENLVAPSGGLPINTSGGNLAEGYLQGMGLVVEAVRQLRKESPNPIPDARVSLMAGGPMAPLVSSVLFGTADVL